jgi:hypothetical protein
MADENENGESVEPININGVDFYSEGEPVIPFLGLTAAKAAALVSKQVG